MRKAYSTWYSNLFPAGTDPIELQDMLSIPLGNTEQYQRTGRTVLLKSFYYSFVYQFRREIDLQDVESTLLPCQIIKMSVVADLKPDMINYAGYDQVFENTDTFGGASQMVTSMMNRNNLSRFKIVAEKTIIVNKLPPILQLHGSGEGDDKAIFDYIDMFEGEIPLDHYMTFTETIADGTNFDMFIIFRRHYGGSEEGISEERLTGQTKVVFTDN